MVRQKSNRKILYKTAKVKVYLHILLTTSIYVYAYVLFFIYIRWITLLTFFFLASGFFTFWNSISIFQFYSTAISCFNEPISLANVLRDLVFN